MLFRPLLTTCILSLVSVTHVVTAFAFQGFGTETLGGAQGTIVNVTNLKNSGPGSLRDALSQGNRRIVFKVKGTILLESPLDVRGSQVTIDGFSAPSPGITIKRYGIRIRGDQGAHDVIITGLRIRDARDDGIQIAWGAYNVVVANVSVHNAGDGSIDITHGAHDVTVFGSILGRTQQSKTMLIKTQTSTAPRETNRVTLHHNLFTKNASRNPRISNLDDGTPATDITTDMRNNLVWDWATGTGTEVECGGTANVINNFYASPNSTPLYRERAILVRGEDFQNGCGGLAYVAGNISGDQLTIDINRQSTEQAPFAAAPVDTTDACTAARDVVANAGVRPLDAVDSQYVSAITISCQ